MSPTTDPIQVTICMPWRPQPDRIAAYERCRKWWESHRFDVVTGDSSRAKPFVCNEARNNAVRQADTDIIVVTDADTLPENLHQVIKAISMVDKGEADIVYPFTMYRYIPPAWVDNPIDELHKAPILGETFNSPGGMIVANRTAFWSINGFDERFIPGASGYDDTSFMLAAKTLLNTQRLFGTVYSFDHPMSVERDYGDTNPNLPRHKLYKLAYKSPDLMTELIKK